MLTHAQFPIQKKLPAVAATVTAIPADNGPSHEPAARCGQPSRPYSPAAPASANPAADGHSYLRRWERPLTTRLPAVPAAVPIYSTAGDTRVLVIDLDTSRGGPDAVHRDAAAITALVHRPAGEVITDESPSRGRHLYVPFTEPIGFHDARDLALALAARTPTMDPSPNQNLTEGLIRPPGSAHPTGGHQVLHGNLTDRTAPRRHRQPPPRLHRAAGAAHRRTGHRPRTAPPARTRRTHPERPPRGAPPRPSGPTGAHRRLPAHRHHRHLRHHQIPVPLRGPASRPRRRRLGRPHPARRPGPHRQRHLAGPRRLLHPLPQPPHPPQSRPRRLAHSPHLGHQTGQLTKNQAMSVNPPQASHHHTGAPHHPPIKINKEEAPPPNTNGSAPGGPP